MGSGDGWRERGAGRVQARSRPCHACVRTCASYSNTKKATANPGAVGGTVAGTVVASYPFLTVSCVDGVIDRPFYGVLRVYLHLRGSPCAYSQTQAASFFRKMNEIFLRRSVSFRRVHNQLQAVFWEALFRDQSKAPVSTTAVVLALEWEDTRHQAAAPCSTRLLARLPSHELQQAMLPGRVHCRAGEDWLRSRGYLMSRL